MFHLVWNARLRKATAPALLKSHIPKTDQVVRYCITFNLGALNKFECLSFKAMYWLYSVILGPKDNQVDRWETLNCQSFERSKAVKLPAEVTTLFKKFSKCTVLKRLASLAMAPWENPQSGMRKVRFIITMLKQRCAIESQEHDSGDPRPTL